MCCSNTPTANCCTPAMPRAVAYPGQCGCGCIGKENTALGLHRYREHLKAELNHIDAQMTKLEDEGQ